MAAKKKPAPLDLDTLLTALDPEGRHKLPLDKRTELLVTAVERLALRMLTSIEAETPEDLSFKDRTVALGVALDKYRSLTTRRKPGPPPKPKPAEEEKEPDPPPEGEAVRIWQARFKTGKGATSEGG